MILNIHWYYFLPIYFGIGIAILSLEYVLGFTDAPDLDDRDEVIIFGISIVLWPILLMLVLIKIYIYMLIYLREYGVEYKNNLKVKALAWWVRYQARKKKPQVGLPDWF